MKEKASALNILKERAGNFGFTLGEKISNAPWKTDLKEAVLATLPRLNLTDLLLEKNLAQTILSELRDLVQNKIPGVDESTAELVVRDALLKSALQSASVRLYGSGRSGQLPDEKQAEKILRQEASFTADKSIEVIVSELLGSLSGSFNKNTTEDWPVLPEELLTDERVLQPPLHSWHGPQPGLAEQFDEQHHFYFSPHTGWLERVVCYDNGQPAWRVHYTTVQETGSVRPRPHSVDCRENDSWVAHEKNSWSDRLTMRGVDGIERVVPFEEKGVYVMPAGMVVKMKNLGSWLNSPRAEFLGRLKDFDPLQPFVLRQQSGLTPISPERNDVVIDRQLYVYEVTGRGLRLLGKAELPRNEIDSLGELPTEITQAHVVVRTQPELTVHLKHPLAFQLVKKDLPQVVGRHIFVLSHVPEMVDVNGGRVAEETLRALEAIAAQLGLVQHALYKEAPTGTTHAVLLSATAATENKLWNTVKTLEEVLGRGTGGVVDRLALREWLDLARRDPDTALYKLVK